MMIFCRTDSDFNSATTALQWYVEDQCLKTLRMLRYANSMVPSLESYALETSYELKMSQVT